MSKIPPQLRQSLPALRQRATAFAFRHLVRPLKDFLAGTQHFVQCFLEVGGALGQLLSYLRNILFEALLDFLAEELLQSSVAKPFCVLRRMVGNNVGDESAREPLCPLIGVLREERIERTSGAAVVGGG
jgi:hypothetical protein